MTETSSITSKQDANSKMLSTISITSYKRLQKTNKVFWNNISQTYDLHSWDSVQVCYRVKLNMENKWNRIYTLYAKDIGRRCFFMFLATSCKRCSWPQLADPRMRQKVCLKQQNYTELKWNKIKQNRNKWKLHRAALISLHFVSIHIISVVLNTP